ncbi:MAG TPA: flagellar hook-associated family protein [Hyphomicrobiaceae bacterium]|nr:flagellar hook-associated family protein [Hyphomicrobiaceae bacterium]
MKTTFISTSAISEATRVSLIKLQTQLATAQKEVSTGRYADMGVSLGYKTGQTVSLRQEQNRLTTITETNSVVATRLDSTQSALTSLVGDAQNFLGQLLGARDAPTGPQVVQKQAQTSLSAFADMLNTSIDGAYLFAGINADVKPISQYDQTPPSPAKQAVDNAFFATFGITQNDPAVANISASAMQNFLDTTFAGLFQDPAWTTNWSSASDQNIRSRISTSELIETSTNTNESAFRQLAQAYTMVADLGTQNLNQGAFQAVVDTATKIAAQGIQGLTELQSNLGTAQQRVEDANGRMSIQKDILTNHISSMEDVDPYEASTRVNTLMTQIETAYAMTARIQQLSLLNYL